MLVPIGAFTPDQADLDVGACDALNVYAAVKSYEPLPSFGAYSTNALTARAQGGASFRKADGTALTFAGDATKLYLLDADGAWQNVSRLAGGAYTTPADRQWFFIKFGNLVIAGNGFDDPQKFDIESATNFSALGGSPPVPIYGAVVGDFVVFVVAGNIVQWSGINNAETWATSSTTQADQQQMPDGEGISGIAGGEYGVILQEQAIRRMSYTADNFIFRFDKVVSSIGCTIPGSVSAVENRVFFCHRSGFFALIDGAQLVPIGAQRVNRTFWADVDVSNIVRITSAIDATKHLYGILYPSNAGDGTPDTMLLYEWQVGDGGGMGWSRAEPGGLEMIFPGISQATMTLEDLDAFGTLDTLPYSLDSSVWAGVPTALFAAFDSSHVLAFANGPSMAATVVTSEASPAGYRQAVLRKFMPMIQGAATITCRVGGRNYLQETVTYGGAHLTSMTGAVQLRPLSARYFRVEINTAAGDAWEHILGVELPSDGYRVGGIVRGPVTGTAGNSGLTWDTGDMIWGVS